ncbi:MAG TPA: diaminopimelate epimerase [Acidimicrobiales bacterium]
MTLTLTKHHGLGNDFLVLLDPPDDLDTAALARAVCDRHRGVGGDGLLVARRGGVEADVTMALHNADGGVAEMSGNGIRCLAQAVVDAGWQRAGTFRIATAGGLRTVDVTEETAPGLRQVTVEMGVAKVREIEGGPTAMAAEVDMGNPHLVLLADATDLDVEALGREHPDVNVELVTPVDDGLVLKVHERGVGLTEACGTGSCAAAAAARRWGLVGDHVVVHNPGGDLAVDLHGDEVKLTGPAQFVARVEWPCR